MSAIIHYTVVAKVSHNTEFIVSEHTSLKEAQKRARKESNRETTPTIIIRKTTIETVTEYKK